MHDVSTDKFESSATVQSLERAPKDVAKSDMSIRKMSLIGAKIALSVGMLWYLGTRHAPSVAQLKSVQLGWAFVAVIIMVLPPALAAVRWRTILGHLAPAPPLATVIRVFYGSQFFSQVLPAGGDVARVVLHSQVGMRAFAVASSVLADRVVGMLGLLVMTLVVLLTGAVPPKIALSLGVVAGGGLMGACAYAIIAPRIAKSAFWRRLPEPVRSLSDVLVWSLSSRAAFTSLQPVSILIHAISLTALYFAALSASVPHPELAVLAAGPVMLLAGALPISIGGWGVREMAAVLLTQAAGVTGSAAVLMSILFGLCVLVASLPGLAVWLLMKSDPVANA